ncbi:hypothetical protein PVT71_07760 [Salipiger sp. H15]|uniref:Restriction system protein Mrr-like N-terminal domain-containing protein n=1 Tax=Alloyangia sp. H15 TaxID=3029062 RepID=A0AAU8AD62_9RHOB
MNLVRSDLVAIVEAVLKHLGGQGTVPEVAKEIWSRHEQQLRASGDLFYTWQYDMRWAAQRLAHRGKLTKVDPRGIWRLL